MKQVLWMTAGCLGSWLVAAGLTDRPTETFLGMAGPLASSAATWLAVERTWRRDPARVTRLLMGALGLKMLFFAAYVVAVSRVPGLDLAVFGVAFFVYFATLYVAQAFLIRGLSVARAS